MTDILAMNRRALLERALILVGAAAAEGFSVTALAKAAAGPRRYLDAPAFALLSAVADTIVPHTETAGALDAGVPASFDALLTTWASGARRYDLTHALTSIDQAARDGEGAGFVDLPPERRKAVLSAYDVTALKPVPRRDGGTSIAVLMAGPSVANPGYGKLKDLIVTLYYLSEPALTQELSYVHAPGEWKPSIPVTPDTRPAAGGAY